MSAVIKHITSPDADRPLAEWRPQDAVSFTLFIELEIGLADEEGADLFGITVCSPPWLAQELAEKRIIPGRHYVFQNQWDFAELKRWLEERVAEATGATWHEIAANLARWARWEFEDYRPFTRDGV